MSLTIYWSLLVSTAVNVRTIVAVGAKVKSGDTLNQDLTTATQRVTSIGLIWMLIGFASLVVLFFISPKPKDNKTLLTSLAVLLFCLFGFTFAQSIMSNFKQSLI